MEKFFLSTYLLKIQDNNNNDQILSRFNGSNDFFKVFEDYLNAIFQNIDGTSDRSQTTSLHLTLDAPPTVDIANRRIYGYFSSGVSGELYKIKDLESRESVWNVERNHGAFRNLFYYVHIPTGRNYGSLILQRRARFGIKTVFGITINKYFKSQGYQLHKVIVNNVVHHSVYRKMMDLGNLKKVELIKRRIPNSIEEYYRNGGNPTQIPGVLKTSMSSSTSLPENFKSLIDNLYNNHSNQTIEIQGIDEEFDEIEFELELNGKNKSFYIANRKRIQPDIDVTASLTFENGIATTESLISQCEELVNDVIEIQPV